jgi:hypothetical protein
VLPSSLADWHQKEENLKLGECDLQGGDGDTSRPAAAPNVADIKLAFFFLLTCFMWGTIVWWSIQKYFSSHFILQGGNKVLDFFISSPDEETVKKFIEEIRLRVREKMKEDFLRFDPDLEFQDQLENLKYLKRIDVLKQDEFEQIREELRKKHLIK